MKRKIISILLTLVLVLSFSLVTAVPVSAAGTPTIDGVIDTGEWDGALEIPVAGGMGTVKLLANTDYLYVLFDVVDSTDARLGENSVGNDKIGLNINPTPGGPWGKPYDIVFQTGADHTAFNTPDPDVPGSSGLTDGWETEWCIDGTQLPLPEDVETMTLYSGGKRISEWQVPLASIDVSLGDTLTVGGACDNLHAPGGAQGNSYSFPPTLDWNDPASTFGGYWYGVNNQDTGLYYQTIQDAIDTASGTTLICAAGIYEENLVINKAGVNLIGPNVGVPGYKTRNAEAVIVGDVRFQAESITFDGFEVAPTPGDKIILQAWPHEYLLWPGLKVQNNRILMDVTHRLGIWIQGDDDNRVEGVVVANNYIQGPARQGGIDVIHTKGALVSGNHIINAGSEKYGIWAFGNDDVTLTGNKVTESLIGLDVAGNDGATVTGNMIQSNVTGLLHRNHEWKHWQTGEVLQTWYPTGSVITGNNFADNDIQVLDAAEVLDIQGVLDTNDFDRAVTVDHDGASLLPTIWSSIQDGIDAAVSGDTVNVAAGTYTENVSFPNDKDGLTLLGANDGVPAGVKPGVRGDESIITGKVVIGASTTGVSYITIDGFTIISGGVTGVYVQAGKDTITISNNIIDCEAPQATGQVQGVGMACNGNPQFVITDNTITNCKQGVLIQGENTQSALVTGNDISNVVVGITPSQGDITAGCTITNNTVSNANLEAISINHDGNVLQGNTFKDSAAGVRFYSEAGSNNVVEGNNIHGNTVGLDNVSAFTVDATYNWWGSPNGPGRDGANGVSGNVDCSPWLPGTWETYYDPDGTAKDTDGDGFSDLEEYWLGTDPEDDTDFPGAGTGEFDTVYVEGDGQVNLGDSGGTIADVGISGGGGGSGTITGTRYTEDPGKATLSVGTGTSGVVFLDVRITGYTEGIAHIIVPYPDVDPADGIVDGTTIVETTLGLYYWDETTSTWLIAANNVVNTLDNEVSGDIPVSALTGTPIGTGGYLEDEAAVAIESILNLNYSVEGAPGGTVNLTIDTNTAFLGGATIDLIFDPTVVEVVAGENSAFNTLTVNTNYAHFGSFMQIARFVAYQEDADGVDATGGVVVAEVKLIAVGSTMEESHLQLQVVTLKDNEGDIVPSFLGENDSIAIVGGIGDASRDGVVDAYDCVVIARAIAGFPDYSIDHSTMDVSGDHMADVWDCTYLARHLAGDPEFPLGG